MAKATKRAGWQNRIVGHDIIAPETLTAHPANWRTHSLHQEAALTAVMDKVGFVSEILVNRRSGLIVDGHLRVAMAISRGEPSVPVTYVDLSEEEEALVLTTLDPIAAMAGADKAQLEALLAGLAGEQDGVRALLDDMARDHGIVLGEPPVDPGAQMDRAEELQRKWGTERGQVWVAGEHKIMVGDSTCEADVAALCAGEAVEALFTDPPYGIDYDPSWLDGVGTKRQALSSRDRQQNDDGSLDLTFLQEYPRRMVWGFPYIADAGATGWIVWDKQPGVEGRGIVTPIEMASTTMRTGFDMVRCMWGGYYRAAGEERMPHPTQKPTAVLAPFIESWTNVGDIVLDLFLGSGTTLVACEQLGRRGFGMEIEPKYVAVSLERLAGLGLTPELANSQT